jgi:hypothetical protein
MFCACKIGMLHHDDGRELDSFLLEISPLPILLASRTLVWVNGEEIYLVTGKIPDHASFPARFNDISLRDHVVDG